VRANKVHLVRSRNRATGHIELACGLAGVRSSNLPAGEMENYIGDRIYEFTEDGALVTCLRCQGSGGGR